MRLVFEMFGSVVVLGRIAATDIATVGAQAQMYPGVAHLHAIFTDVLRRLGDVQMVEVAAGRGVHRANPFVEAAPEADARKKRYDSVHYSRIQKSAAVAKEEFAD
jgi:hypothetical protein